MRNFGTRDHFKSESVSTSKEGEFTGVWVTLVLILGWACVYFGYGIGD